MCLATYGALCLSLEPADFFRLHYSAVKLRRTLEKLLVCCVRFRLSNLTLLCQHPFSLSQKPVWDIWDIFAIKAFLTTHSTIAECHVVLQTIFQVCWSG